MKADDIIFNLHHVVYIELFLILFVSAIYFVFMVNKPIRQNHVLFIILWDECKLCEPHTGLFTDYRGCILDRTNIYSIRDVYSKSRFCGQQSIII